MNKKSTTVFVKTSVMALLFLSLMMGLAVPMQTVRAATITVCASGCDYTTIQAAITAAAVGDTINVAVGTYAGQIIVDKSVFLIGDPGDVSPGPGPNAPVIDGGGAAGSAFFIANGVSNVTIQGFEMRNFTTGTALGAGNGASNDTIKGFDTQNFITGTSFGIGNGISAWVASTSNITVQDNYFHNLGYNAVLVGNDLALGDHTNWTIKANILETFSAYGFELTNTSNSSIEGNLIHSDALSNPQTCIMVDARKNETGITIKDNQIDGALPNGVAIFIFANSFEVPNANLDNVLVQHNTISSTGLLPQVYIYNYPGTGTVTGVQVHLNSLITLKTNTPARVDAIMNWWGDLDPSNNVIGNVKYSPWCTDASCTTFVTAGGDTTGVFRPSNVFFYLKNANTTGIADVAIKYGKPGDHPVVGDWDGNGTTTIGIYRNGVFYLRNTNISGIAEFYFPFGAPGDQPVAGDWDGDGIDTIGVYNSSTGTFYLRNSNDAGIADISFNLGSPGDIALAGDWNGDGFDTAGVFRPSISVFYLKNTNFTGIADLKVIFGLVGDKPVTGDWNNDGTDTIGIFRGGMFYLRNTNTTGFADLKFGLGIPGDLPIVGNWDGLP